MVGLPDEGLTLGGEGVCGRGGGAFQAKGEFSGSLVTLGPVDLTSRAHPSVFLQGPVPRTNQRLPGVLW